MKVFRKEIIENSFRATSREELKEKLIAWANGLEYDDEITIHIKGIVSDKPYTVIVIDLKDIEQRLLEVFRKTYCEGGKID